MPTPMNMVHTTEDQATIYGDKRPRAPSMRIALSHVTPAITKTAVTTSMQMRGAGGALMSGMRVGGTAAKLDATGATATH